VIVDLWFIGVGVGRMGLIGQSISVEVYCCVGAVICYTKGAYYRGIENGSSDGFAIM